MHASKEEIKELGRLQKRSDFLQVQNNGKKWVSKSVIVIAYVNNDMGRRFGLTATKRLSKSAVVRNKIRRRLRSVARDVLPIYSRDNTDYVLIGRNESATQLYSDLQRDLKWCLKKLDCRNDQPN